MGFAAVPPFQNLAYVGQATHRTTIKKYEDTLNFAILKGKTSTAVSAFSISNIGGAFGDEGPSTACCPLARRCEVLSGGPQQGGRRRSCTAVSNERESARLVPRRRSTHDCWCGVPHIIGGTAATHTAGRVCVRG
jgi:hypothetical protein